MNVTRDIDMQLFGQSVRPSVGSGKTVKL